MFKLTKIAVITLMGTSSMAFALSTSTNFTVTADVASQGAVNVTAAPVFTITGGQTQAAAGGAFTVSVNTLIQPTIYFTPASSTTTPAMSSATASATLPYNLYLPTGGSAGNYGSANAACPSVGSGTALSYGVGNTYNVLAGGVVANGTFNICAQARGIPADQKAASDYTDTVTLGLNY